MKDSRTILLQIIGMGVIAGMRSMAAPALVSDHFAGTYWKPLARTAFKAMSSPKVATALKTLAVGEMAADKSSWVPDRTELPALLGRIASGALVGAVLSVANDQRPVAGAVLGGVAAAAATYGAYHLRIGLGRQLRLPDSLVGILEDVAVVGAGLRLMKLAPEFSRY